MSKHTPGPWRVASDQNSVGNTVWAGDLPVAICSPVRVFLASRQTAQLTGAEASANARLIAAAPELLEALKEITPPMPPTDAPCHVGIVPQEKCAHCGRIARARAAIAKATGEQQ